MRFRANYGLGCVYGLGHFVPIVFFEQGIHVIVLINAEINFGFHIPQHSIIF